jgi:release factor glutamine methyltransferase
MDIRQDFISSLIDAKILSPRLETDIIIKHSMPNYPSYTLEELEQAKLMLVRRLNHEPLDKIIGKREFYKYEFKVNSQVLSPRPDTEILVEKAISLINKDESIRVLDLGTGSGCIILSILKDCPNVIGTAVDISPKSLEIARQNAYDLKVDDRVEFLEGSWNDIQFTSQYDVIVSNPPYIPTKEIEDLDVEVKKYDPMHALDGGSDGLDCYRQIAKISYDLLKKDGYIFLEVGYNQAEIVNEIFKQNKFIPYEIVKDLSSINRCVILKK